MNAITKFVMGAGFGAFCGTIVALETPPHFWWVGALTALIVSYSSCDWQEVIQAVKTAWQESVDQRQKKRAELIRTALRRKRVRRFKSLAYRVILPWYAFLVLTCALYGTMIGGAISMLAGTDPYSEIPNFSFTMGTGFLAGSMLTWSLFAIAHSDVNEAADKMIEQRTIWVTSWAKSMRNSRQRTKEAVIWCNPATVLVYWLPVGLYNLAPQAANLAKRVFILIHSRKRVLCAIDGACGLLVGFSHGNALIGLIAGMAFGFVSYEIVSRQILKVTPNGT